MKAISRDGVLQTVLPLIRGKRVLDVGCVQHSVNNMYALRLWGHDFVRWHAASPHRKRLASITCWGSCADGLPYPFPGALGHVSGFAPIGVDESGMP